MARSGDGKQLVKLLMSHGWLGRLLAYTDGDHLAHNGEIAIDLRWSGLEVPVIVWNKGGTDRDRASHGYSQRMLKSHHRLVIHAVDFGYSRCDECKRVRVKKEIVLNLCKANGSEIYKKHIFRCFQLVCDMLRALDAEETHVDNPGLPDVRDRYGVSVWCCYVDQWGNYIDIVEPEAQKAGETCDGHSPHAKKLRRC